MHTQKGNTCVCFPSTSYLLVVIDLAKEGERMKLTLAAIADICHEDVRTVKVLNASEKGLTSLEEDLR